MADSSGKKIRVEISDINRNSVQANELHINKTPATVILSSNGAKLYFFGMPSGHQLRCLVEAIVDCSRASTDLADGVKERIRKIDQPVDIKVFVTPACPYSPVAVRTAHRFGIENPLNVCAQMVESIEFTDLTQQYGVVGVPTTFINDLLRFEGTLTDELFSQKVSEAAATRSSSAVAAASVE